MHEVGIAKNIIDVVQQQLPQDETLAVKSIHVKVGALARVTPDALRFGFQIAREQTRLNSTELIVEEVPASMECEACEVVTVQMEPILICPSCASTRLKMLSGNELEVTKIEYE